MPLCMWRHIVEQMLPPSEIIRSTYSSHPHAAMAPFVPAFTKQGDKQCVALLRREWRDCSFCLILSIILKWSAEIAENTES